MENQNKIAKFLKTASIILFVCAVLGSIFGSLENVTVYESKYSWKDAELVTKQVFNFATFFGSLISNAISSLLMYGFGELIQLQEDNKALLTKISAKQNL